MVRACHSCQANKIGRHTKTPLNSFDPPDRRFGDIHVDLVGPFPPSEGCTYLFTIIDRFTRWPEAVPIQNAEATICARALLRTWIARFGVQDSITSDQGPQFTSGLWRELHNVLGCSNKHTTAYHPQSNGIVERFHRSIKAALKARLLGPGWMDELPIVLLGIRSTWKEDLDAAPALLTYGTNLRIPGDFFPSNSAERISPGSTFVRDLQENFRKLSPLSPVHHGKTKKYLPRDLMSAEQVYVRHDAHRGPLVRPYDGPFKVLYRSDKHFDILRNNKSTRVSIDRLKPAYSADPKFPPPAVHPHDQAPRVDDNSRSETVSSIHRGGFWTTLYEKHTTSTCTRTPILLVRKTRSAYIHSDPNSARTQNTLYGKVRPKWNQGSQGHSRASPREDGPYNSPASGETTHRGLPGLSKGSAASPRGRPIQPSRPWGETPHRGLPKTAVAPAKCAIITRGLCPRFNYFYPKFSPLEI